MEIEGLQGEVVNLGSDDEITILDLCDTSSKITHESLPEDDPARRQPDLSKAREILGFEPEVSLREGLERTVSQFEEDH